MKKNKLRYNYKIILLKFEAITNDTKNIFPLLRKFNNGEKSLKVSKDDLVFKQVLQRRIIRKMIALEKKNIQYRKKEQNKLQLISQHNNFSAEANVLNIIDAQAQKNIVITEQGTTATWRQMVVSDACATMEYANINGVSEFGMFLNITDDDLNSRVVPTENKKERSVKHLSSPIINNKRRAVAI